jgi:hypothetical protein
MTPAGSQLEGFFARYEPRTAAFGRAARAKLRARLPGLNEIVYLYERQDALVIAWSPTEQGYEGLCSLSVRPDGVKLHFPQGVRLAAADSGGRLRGRGDGVRHLVLRHADDLDQPAVEALLAAALALANVRVDLNAEGAVIIRAEAQQKRARRAQEGRSTGVGPQSRR